MLKNSRQFIVVHFAGHELLLLASGGCYWPAKKSLIVSDLHLEKGSYFAVKGHPLPTTDTRHTLERLQSEIIQFQPETVICLGDNFHDKNALMRMNTQDLSFLQSLCTEITHWKWVIGNHDTMDLEDPLLQGMQFAPEVIVDDICFTHEFREDRLTQIIGHYHPKISLKKHGIKMTGKCFSVAENKIIMPAFGSYTGGLDINHKVYNDIINGSVAYYMIFKDNIFFVK